MPSYGGVNIFGASVTMSTVDSPREKQVNSFFGLSGLETLDGGSRGRVTEVGGILYGAGPAALAGAETTFRSFDDGVSRVLVDSLGAAWGNVVLQSFRPMGRVRQSPFGVFFRAYRARFLHLE
jgi:hypothetical protein